MSKILKQLPKCFWSFLVVITFSVQASRLPGDLSRKQPKIFKILEANNRIYLKRDDQTGLNPKDLNIFLENNADLQYNTNNIDHQARSINIPYRQLKKALVKRTVPHNYKSPDVEFDAKHKSYFRPLVRFHKTKKLSEVDTRNSKNHLKLPAKKDLKNKMKGRSDQNRYFENKRISRVFIQDEEVHDFLEQLGLKLPEKTGIQHNKPTFRKVKKAIAQLNNMNIIARIVKIPIKGNEKLSSHATLILKQTYKVYNDAIKIIELLYDSKDISEKHLKKQMQYLDSELTDVELTALLLKELIILSSMIKEPVITQKINIILRRISAEVDIVYKKFISLFSNNLRARNDDEFETDKHHFTQDTILGIPDELESSVEYSKQSLWNFWTYPKQIYQHVCPGDSVLVRGVCVSVPPH